MRRPGLRFALLCFACTCFGCRENGGVSTRSGDVELTSQSAYTRQFVRVPVDTVRMDIAVENLFVRSVMVLPDSSLLVNDESSRVLLRVNADGRVRSVVGRGRGGGPGEHVMITNYGQLASGEIWTFDASQNRVTVFDAAGQPINTIPLKVGLPQATVTEEAIYGYSLVEGGQMVQLAPEGDIERVITGFGKRVRNNDSAPGLEWAGHIVSDPGAGSWFYVSSNTGGLLGFDRAGSSRFAVYGIDGGHEPSIVKEGETFVFDPSTPVPVQLFAVNAWRGTLYVLAVHNETGAMFLDAYSTEAGTYQYSMRIPVSRGCAPVFVTDDTVYSRCPSGLIRLSRADSVAAPAD